MTHLPHLIVACTVEVDGRACEGISADGLPPKWFTKNPTTRFDDDDLPEMLRSIRHAADLASQIGTHADFFRWWIALDHDQHDWAHSKQIPGLLAGFGSSLIERAVIDAVCRSKRMTLNHAFRTNLLDIDFRLVRHGLGNFRITDALPSQPRDSIRLRHTVGLADALDDQDSQAAGDPCDGLPYTLRENIQAYGLRLFKIKLSGQLSLDRERLSRIATLLEELVGIDARITLDGNENFATIEEFREAWETLCESDTVRRFLQRSLLFVEQPVHRSSALDPSVKTELSGWPGAPPIIIDESDADLESLPTALSLGYRGTSHKNCKGIMKGLIGAATIRQQSSASHALIQSAEDLANIGPIALQQDLAMVGALGITHVERNGHQYFRGLSMFPEEIQHSVIRDNPDLYHWHKAGFPSLAIENGCLSLTTVHRAIGMGVGKIPDLHTLPSFSI